MLKTLKQSKNYDPDLVTEVMKTTYFNMSEMQHGVLKTDDYEYYTRERVLNKHRQFLVNIIESSEASQLQKDLALKLIVLLGNLRWSGEDYLIAYNLIQIHNLNFNIISELK
jgi:hypothetical protein